MGWSPGFQTALASRVAVPMFRLDVYAKAGAPGNTGAVLRSHSGTADYTFAIARDQVRVSSGTLTPGSWSISYGGMSVGLHGGASRVSDLLQSSIVRGSMCRLYMGFEGWSSDDFEPIFTGQIRQLRGTPHGGYTLEAWDILSALGCRWTTTRGEEAGFFNLRELASTVIANSDYTAASDTTIEVSDSSMFEREDAGNYLLRVTPTGGTDFYIRASSVASDVFTIDTGGVGVYGTTDQDAVIGDTVTHMALLEDHPKDIVRKLLISTGTAGAAHADFDKYPAGWSWGVPVEWVDVDDIGDAMTLAQVDTTVGLEVVVTEAQTDPSTWLQGVLDDAGFFLVHRQGEVSLRAGTNPLMTTPGPVYTVAHISDSDIQTVIDYQAWDGGAQVEYPSVSTTDANGGGPLVSNEDIKTLPASKTFSRTLAHAWTSGSTHRTDADRRLKIWHHRIPERVSLELIGWTHAGLVPGDVVSLTSGFIPSRAGGTMDGRKGIVLSCNPDWLAGVTRLDLSLVAEWSTEFPS